MKITNMCCTKSVPWATMKEICSKPQVLVCHQTAFLPSFALAQLHRHHRRTPGVRKMPSLAHSRCVTARVGMRRQETGRSEGSW